MAEISGFSAGGGDPRLPVRMGKTRGRGNTGGMYEDLDYGNGVDRHVCERYEDVRMTTKSREYIQSVGVECSIPSMPFATKQPRQQYRIRQSLRIVRGDLALPSIFCPFSIAIISCLLPTLFVPLVILVIIL